MNVRRIFICAAIALAVGVGAAGSLKAQGAEQDPNRLTSLQVSVWPEYDQPNVLVMFDGVLAETTGYPREISVLIPSTATLHVATFENPDGTLAPEQVSKTTVLGDGWTRVVYTIQTPAYHLEYYDNAIKGLPDKTIDFVYRAAAPATQVRMEIQQPLRSTSMTLNPPAMSVSRFDNFQHHVFEYSNVTAGQSVPVQVKYNKGDSIPSVQPQQSPGKDTSAIPAASTPAPSSPWTTAFAVAALVVLGVAAVLGVFTFQRSRTPAVAKANVGRRRRELPPKRAMVETSNSVFCTQCGRALGPEDNFCPRCGAKRRMV